MRLFLMLTRLHGEMCEECSSQKNPGCLEMTAHEATFNKAVDSILGQAHTLPLDLRSLSRLATHVAEQTRKVRLLPCLRTTQEREQVSTT